jgi:hypothetical protein
MDSFDLSHMGPMSLQMITSELLHSSGCKTAPVIGARTLLSLVARSMISGHRHRTFRDGEISNFG